VTEPDRFAVAVAAIDAANAEDPTTVTVRGDVQPLALAHGRLAAEWIVRLDPSAPEEVLLAARAHHLRRWQVPRTSYPEGRSGYLVWRRDQKQRHATDLAVIMAAAGYPTGEIARTQELVRRDRLATDPGAQAVEDAACLVFIETQLTSVAAKLEPERLREVIRKTARKMSPAAIDAISELQLTEHERSLLTDALR
jgi:Domain of unknown function (DUF4202)